MFFHISSKNVHFDQFRDGVRLGDQNHWIERTFLHKKMCICHACRGVIAFFHIWLNFEYIYQTTIFGNDKIKFHKTANVQNAKY